MSERPIEDLPLREMCTNCEHLMQKLIDHVDRGFLPKAERLNELIQESMDDSDSVQDVTIRHDTSRVLESEAFTAQAFSETERYFEAIDRTVAKAIEEA